MEIIIEKRKKKKREFKMMQNQKDSPLESLREVIN